MDINIDNLDINLMDIEQARTFLAIAAHGSFLEAAKRLHITQSTVSARMQNLENYFGSKLFIRNRSGATLTPAGRNFMRHAKALVLTLEQAIHDVGLPSRYTGSITVGGRIALWEDFLPQWVGWMRHNSPDISIRSDIGFEEDLMRRLIEGNLDIGLMYTPQHSPSMQVEHLFDETLVLLSSRRDIRWPDEDYIYVEWGTEFNNQHINHFPDLERPAQVVNIGWLGIQLIMSNGGSCFLPIRMAKSFLKKGLLHRVPESPEFTLPAYMVYPRDYDSEVIDQALNGLRYMASLERGL